ncbi:hypothetical protein [uncultured Clostridium sp.]|uniref:hypothetical protein n=1 Tax=uncultured Clostridium sp. TaxID=59620 RepID=UPI00261077C9|nr:hypothetical protein [uncultured Clostridium sp.]
MARIELDNRIFNDMQFCLNIAMNELKEQIEDDEVIPYQTGELQESAVVKNIGSDTVRLEYEDTKANIIYYLHPELNGRHWHDVYGQNTYHNNKVHNDWNTNAQSEWLANYINNPDILVGLYVSCLKKNTDWFY